MRKLIILLFGALIGLPALAQVPIYTINGDTLMFPVELFKVGVAVTKRLPIKVDKASKLELNMGMDVVYIPETDLAGGNASGKKSTVIVYHVPAGVTVSDAQVGMISAYVKNLLQPPVVLPDLITTIDDAVSDTRNVYSANWFNSVNQNWNTNHFANTASFTTVTGSTVEVTIDGYKFDWYTEKRLNHGTAGVKIDDQPEVMVDLYAKREDNNSVVVYSSPTLTNGIHKVTIRMTGAKNPAWSTDYPAGTAAQNQLRADSQQNNISNPSAFKKSSIRLLFKNNVTEKPNPRKRIQPNFHAVFSISSPPWLGCPIKNRILSGLFAAQTLRFAAASFAEYPGL